MTKGLEKQVLEYISFVPGLVGLSSLDFTKKAKRLSDENLCKGTSFEETSKGVIVRIALFFDRNVRVKLICSQISAAIANIFKKSNVKFNKVIIYVVGIK